MAWPELEAWQYSALVAAVTSAVFLCGYGYVEGHIAMSTRMTYHFLKAHKSVSSVAGAISDHWGQLSVVSTLFLAHTIAQSQTAALDKYKADYPWTVAAYYSTTITAAACYASSAYSCIVHRTASAGLKEIAMTKYVLSMPRCIGGPLMLVFTAWVVGCIGTVIGFTLEQNFAVAVFAVVVQLVCWSAVFYTAYVAFTLHKNQMDLESIEECWLKIHGGHIEPDDDDEEDDSHNVQGQEGWGLVTHSLAKEIMEHEEKSQKNSEFSAAIKEFLNAKHEECLGKLKKNPRDAPRDLIASFHGLHLARELAQ